MPCQTRPRVAAGAAQLLGRIAQHHENRRVAHHTPATCVLFNQKPRRDAWNAPDPASLANMLTCSQDFGRKPHPVTNRAFQAQCSNTRQCKALQHQFAVCHSAKYYKNSVACGAYGLWRCAERYGVARKLFASLARCQAMLHMLLNMFDTSPHTPSFAVTTSHTSASCIRARTLIAMRCRCSFAGHGKTVCRNRQCCISAQIP